LKKVKQNKKIWLSNNRKFITFKSRTKNSKTLAIIKKKNEKIRLLS